MQCQTALAEPSASAGHADGTVGPLHSWLLVDEDDVSKEINAAFKDIAASSRVAAQGGDASAAQDAAAAL